MSPNLVSVWRKIIVGDDKSWVLFQHGTCVVFPQHTQDLRRTAAVLLADWGPVGSDNPVRDFRTVKLTKDPGWVVACRHPDILNYIGPDDLEPGETDEMRIGMLGRGRRFADSAEQEVIHVEVAGQKAEAN